MKIIKITTLIIATFLFAVSCKNSESQEHHENHETHENATQREKETTSISLNNGEKWQVNEEMKPFIERSETLLNSYVSGKSQDYQSLAKELENNNNALIKSCTMDGRSHEELHVWLKPHLEMTTALATTKNSDEAQPIITDLQNSFKTYHQYFQ